MTQDTRTIELTLQQARLLIEVLEKAPIAGRSNRLLALAIENKLEQAFSPPPAAQQGEVPKKK